LRRLIFATSGTRFGIKAKDRTRHMYIIGKTGMGKSTMLENLAIQDIQNDEGLIFIDPHGSAAVNLLSYVPKHRIDDIIYFSPADTDFPVSFNVLEQVSKDKRSSVAAGLMNAFKKIWVDAWSARMEYLLNYSILALLDVPGTTPSRH
jgi:DNA helicase HerA-like ATPase